jgi:pimeloyl-ACP methyl ester carboxylesterase
MTSPLRRARASTVVPIVTATCALAGLGLALAWAVHSRNRVQHSLPLTSALDAELRFFESPSAGRLGYYVAGPQQRGKAPVLMLHSVNAAASSFEMRPLFERLAQTHRVYALDLPGFGFSARANREYTPELMRNAVIEFLLGVLKGLPVHAIALSLGCEFLALAAQEQPSWFRTLTLLSPTGFGARARQNVKRPRLLRALLSPTLRRPLFDLLTTRPSIRFFTRLSAARPLPAEFSDYAYVTSHQADAEFAPLHFIASALFTPDIADVYMALKQPALLLHGSDRFAGVEGADALLAYPNWQIAPFDRAGALPHWDFPETVAHQIEAHLTQK